ncbi:MAG TPA: peroxidase [Actinobacteria bacterium]|nr:peroxidase [Actinomycetota bacterium]
MRRLLRDDDLLAAIEADWRRAPLDDRRRAILAFAEKLTLRPGSMVADDVEALRRVGLDDRDVLDVVQVVAYYAYANRIADGLGVRLEPWFDPEA